MSIKTYRRYKFISAAILSIFLGIVVFVEPLLLLHNQTVVYLYGIVSILAGLWMLRLSLQKQRINVALLTPITIYLVSGILESLRYPTVPISVSGVYIVLLFDYWWTFYYENR